MSDQRETKGTASREALILPEEYRPHLDMKETEEAIKYIKDSFQVRLARQLNLRRVSAPVAILSRTGVNDRLTGVERPVSFLIKDMNEQAEIVQSLAKWKRLALADYSFAYGEGLYTDMNAIRPDEKLDNLHSIYVDQWDWERVINNEERNLDYLRSVVGKIYSAMREEEQEVCRRYKQLPGPFLPPGISFIHSEELEERFPDLPPMEREKAICREKRAVFVIGIGGRLKSGKPHDERAADYDDWSTATGEGRRGLNGDILVWYPLLECAFELSSMGIRVDKESLYRQLRIKNETDKINLYFHQRLVREELPLSIGGGIGQSRLCMLYLRKAHIGEVQSCIWPDNMIDVCRENNVPLL